MKPTLHMLIGVPGSGKSTYTQEMAQVAPDFAYISSDHYIEKFAKRMGKTYDEVFSEVAPRAMRLMNRAVRRARAQQRDIVWDQTNTSAKKRAEKLAMLPEYRKVAVFFVTPPKDILDARLASRPGKSIPSYVMRGMINALQSPTLEEGFDMITKFDSTN